MKLGNSIITGRFVSRPNRFTVLAKSRAKTLRCYFPNPGRLKELLEPDAWVALNQVPVSNRRTLFDLVAVSTGRLWVSVDSRIPNKIVNEALQNGALQEYSHYSKIIPEVRFGHSRIDFLLKSDREKCLLEVKSCTLVKRGLAKFPDAPTARGRRHLLDLIRAKRRGFRACVMFVIQRSDVNMFTPNRQTDPEFVRALELAKISGIEITARKCNIRNFNIQLSRAVPVKV